MGAVTEEKVVRVIHAKPELDLKNRQKVFMRVAAYCRVSTDQEEQMSSFEAQRDYYIKKIMSNPNWSLVDIFADEGISGTRAKNRKEFMRMIKWCRQGKIDLILTKSISRFARNTVECLEFIRELKELGVSVIFEKEGIDTMKTASELSISFISAFAQSESESISGNVAWGKRKAFSNGCVPFQYKNFLGYRKGEDGRPEIDPGEAKTVKRIYREFLLGKSIGSIKKDLERDGVLTARGNKIWAASTIQSILSNERYKGDALLQKTYVTDCISKKIRRNNGELPKYYITGNHPAIIEPEVFDKVQLELAKRNSKPRTSEKQGKTMLGKYSSKYALTERLVCGNCGTPYRRVTWTKRGKKKIVWRCVSRLDYGTKYCADSPTIEESVIQDAVVRIINSLLRDKRECLEALKMNICRGMDAQSVNDDEYNIKARMGELRQNRQSLIMQIGKNAADMETLEAQFKLIADELEELSRRLAQIDDRGDATVNSEMLDEITDAVNKADVQMNNYDDVIVRQVVDQIKVISKDEVEITFIGGITETVML